MTPSKWRNAKIQLKWTKLIISPSTGVCYCQSMACRRIICFDRLLWELSTACIGRDAAAMLVQSTAAKTDFVSMMPPALCVRWGTYPRSTGRGTVGGVLGHAQICSRSKLLGVSVSHAAVLNSCTRLFVLPIPGRYVQT